MRAGEKYFFLMAPTPQLEASCCSTKLVIEPKRGLPQSKIGSTTLTDYHNWCSASLTDYPFRARCMCQPDYQPNYVGRSRSRPLFFKKKRKFLKNLLCAFGPWLWEHGTPPGTPGDLDLLDIYRVAVFHPPIIILRKTPPVDGC